MILFYTASQDATIYLQQPFQNTGIDEMLEISKVYYGSNTQDVAKDYSRVLIQFDNIELPNVPFSASLQLKITKADEIAARFNIEAYPISQSWENGTGTRFDNLTTNGATWYYKNGGDTATIWNNTYIDGFGASFNPFTTGSETGLGGTWFTSSVSTQSFQYTLDDINLDITEFVKQWDSGSIENNGIILKFPSDKENDDVDYASIKIYSKETNTIYQPK
jgi:hypothetical protein